MARPYVKKQLINKEPSKDTSVIFGWNTTFHIELMKGKKFKFVDVLSKEVKRTVWRNDYQKKAIAA